MRPTNRPCSRTSTSRRCLTTTRKKRSPTRTGLGTVLSALSLLFLTTTTTTTTFRSSESDHDNRRHPTAGTTWFVNAQDGGTVNAGGGTTISTGTTTTATTTTTTTATTTATTSSSSDRKCPLYIWIFNSTDSCKARTDPIAKGTLYADDACHTAEIDDYLPSLTYDGAARLMPGTYSARCKGNGQQLVEFVQSGCRDGSCGSATGSTECDRSISDSPSTYYSLLDPPHFFVQDFNSYTKTCLIMTGQQGTDGTRIVFAIFGDCNDPDCVAYAPTTGTDTTGTTTTTDEGNDEELDSTTIITNDQTFNNGSNSNQEEDGDASPSMSNGDLAATPSPSSAVPVPQVDESSASPTLSPPQIDTPSLRPTSRPSSAPVPSGSGSNGNGNGSGNGNGNGNGSGNGNGNGNGSGNTSSSGSNNSITNISTTRTCSICPTGTRMTHEEKSLLVSDYKCSDLIFAMPSSTDSTGLECSVNFDIPFINVPAYCGCVPVEDEDSGADLTTGDEEDDASPLVEECRLCQGGGALLEEDLLDTTSLAINIPDFDRVSVTCREAMGLSLYITEDWVCSSLSYSFENSDCCTMPSLPPGADTDETDGVEDTNTNEQDEGEENKDNADEAQASTCVVCPDGSVDVELGQRVVPGSEGLTCEDIVNAKTSCDAIMSQESSQSIDLAAYCGCPGAEIPNKCEPCPASIDVRNAASVSVSLFGEAFDCFEAVQLPLYAVDEATCESIANDGIRSTCCPGTDATGTSSTDNGAQGEDSASAVIGSDARLGKQVFVVPTVVTVSLLVYGITDLFLSLPAAI